jgi:hypothetical protein
MEENPKRSRVGALKKLKKNWEESRLRAWKIQKNIYDVRIFWKETVNMRKKLEKVIDDKCLN